jgi:hypothetical protein
MSFRALRRVTVLPDETLPPRGNLLLIEPLSVKVFFSKNPGYLIHGRNIRVSQCQMHILLGIPVRLHAHRPGSSFRL